MRAAKVKTNVFEKVATGFGTIVVVAIGTSCVAMFAYSIYQLVEALIAAV